MPQKQSDHLVPLDQQSVEDFCRDPFDMQNHIKLQSAILHFQESNRINASANFSRDIHSKSNWRKISSDVARINKTIDAGIKQLVKGQQRGFRNISEYYFVVRIRNLYMIKSLIFFLSSEDFIMLATAIKESAFDYARACPHLSQASAQTRCSPARKFRAVFS